jgi:hypothetical protein
MQMKRLKINAQQLLALPSCNSSLLFHAARPSRNRITVSFVLRGMLFIDYVHCLYISIVLPFCEAIFLPYFCEEVLEILFIPWETW